MNKIGALLCLSLLIPDMARAETSATQPAIITGTLGPAKNSAKIAGVLGRSGVLLVRSKAHWDELHKFMPDMMPGTPRPQLDFAQNCRVLVYDTARRQTDTFSLSKCTLEGSTPNLDYFLRWDNSPEEQTEFRFAKFILAVMPTTPIVKVTVHSQPTLVDRARAVQEFSASLGGPGGGDIVDGLQAVIKPKTATIKPGEDILMDVELHIAPMPDAHPEQFNAAPAIVYVWDGKYSNGYRNHAFIVTTPQGKTIVLRPKEIAAWDKNIPHPVAVSVKEPYHLPNWVEGETFKSLKGLGLDTSSTGTYSITGLYEESAGVGGRGRDDKTALWCGVISSNTVIVEVKE